MMLRMLTFIMTGLLVCTNAWAGNATQMIAENIKGTKILNVSVHTMPHDDGLMVIIETSAGQRKFIVSRDEIVGALAMLQNPEAYGASNAILLNRTIPHIPSARPLAMAKTPVKLPTGPTVAQNPVVAANPVINTTTVATPQQIQAPAIVSSMVLSANQQASK